MCWLPGVGYNGTVGREGVPYSMPYMAGESVVVQSFSVSESVRLGRRHRVEVQVEAKEQAAAKETRRRAANM